MRMDFINRWGAPVGYLVVAGIYVAAFLFTLAIVLTALGAALVAWHFLMGA